MEAEGTLVWYRSDNNRGVVRLDDGRRYLFHKIKDLENPEPLLRVRVLNVEKGPTGLVVTALKDGGREFGRVPPPRVRGPIKAGDKKVKRNPDAPPDGSPVRHTTYGPGVVIGATAKMVRVRFNEDGKERSVRLTSLTDLAAEEAEAKKAESEKAATEKAAAGDETSEEGKAKSGEEAKAKSDEAAAG